MAYGYSYVFLACVSSHCVFSGSVVHAVVGTNVLLWGGERYKSTKQIRHSGYNQFNNMHHNDIGLIMVDKAIHFDKLIQPVALPKYDISQHNYPAVITGWGSVRVSGDSYIC